MRALREAYAEATIGFADVAASFQAWEAHAAHGDTVGLARAIRAATVLRRRSRPRARRSSAMLGPSIQPARAPSR